MHLPGTSLMLWRCGVSVLLTRMAAPEPLILSGSEVCSSIMVGYLFLRNCAVCWLILVSLRHEMVWWLSRCHWKMLSCLLGLFMPWTLHEAIFQLVVIGRC